MWLSSRLSLNPADLWAFAHYFSSISGRQKRYIKQSHVAALREHFLVHWQSCDGADVELPFDFHTRPAAIKNQRQPDAHLFHRVPTAKPVGTSPSSLLLFTLQQIQKVPLSPVFKRRD